MVVFAGVLLLLAVIVEGTVVSLPFVLSLLIVFHIVYRSWWVLVAAFVAGLLLDSMLFRQLGQSSLLFLSLLFLMIVYERRFEVQSKLFFLLAQGFGISSYLLFFGSSAFVLQTLLIVLFGCIVFLMFGRKTIPSHTLVTPR
ncbi:MAG: hypothetical protein HYV40_04815 [Candidatus Levybacteria bacterium]|nr:hypothetical protein [Candidatus Levybacteria bacterium]